MEADGEKMDEESPMMEDKEESEKSAASTAESGDDPVPKDI